MKVDLLEESTAESGSISGVDCGESGFIRGVDFGESGFIRGVDLVKVDL